MSIKKGWSDHLTSLISFLITYAFVYWVSDTSRVISGFIALGLWQIAALDRKIDSLKQQFQIADAELLRVSTLATSLQAENKHLQSHIEQIKEEQLPY